jgi:hypothetical protein
MGKRGFKTGAPKTTTEPLVAKAPDKPFVYTPAWKLFKPSLQLLRRNFEAVAVIAVLPALLIILGGSLSEDDAIVSGRLLLGTLIMFAAGALLFLNVSVAYYFQLRVIGGGRPGIVECYRNGLRYLPRVFGLMILTGLLVTGGMLLLIVPGLILFRRYILAPFFLVDEDLGIREAMQRSAAATKPARRHVWDVIGLLIAVGVVASTLTQSIPSPYGEIASILVGIPYIFGPALRYREIALQKSALTTSS